MSHPRFSDPYFAFLLSGSVDDFQRATEAFQEILREGATLEDIQECMDESHTSAELLCFLVDNASVKKLG
jgi:hypothetical protein